MKTILAALAGAVVAGALVSSAFAQQEFSSPHQGGYKLGPVVPPEDLGHDVSPEDVGLPSPDRPGNPPEKGSENVLVLPSATGPDLGAPLPTLPAPTLPSAFLGCWQGEPKGFDWSATDQGIVRIGEPGNIVFCYFEHYIDVPQAEVRVSSGLRALDVALHLGFGYTSFEAHGIETAIFGITPTQIRARTNLVVRASDHWFGDVRAQEDQPSQVDWLATLVAPDTVLVKANQVVWNQGLRIWGEWHAHFHRAATP